MNIHFNRLSVLQFRNHREMELEPGPQLNCITGPNGAGKTNLLDAVHYLGLCKSYFESQDGLNVLHGEEFFLVKGALVTPEGVDDLACTVRKGHRKVFTRNRKEYDRLSEHVGRCPVVMITPYDGTLVQDGSDTRRRFLDGLIAQFDRSYLEALLRYNRALAHRNLLLKNMAGRGDLVLAEPWDEQIIVNGEAVHTVRKAFMEELVPLLLEHYAGISSGPEHVGAHYRSELGERSMREILAANWDRDLAAEHTTGGIHKDDLVFTLNEQPLKRFGSQGQQKTFLIALKLAQFDLTAKHNGTKPILLLDDIFDKIDPQRMRHLLALLGQGRFGQVIITDTDATRLHKAIDGLRTDTRFFELDHPKLGNEQRTVVEGSA